MPPKATRPNTPGVETRAARARRLAAEVANASNTNASSANDSDANASDNNASDPDASNDARRAAANATISPIIPSPPVRPPPRSVSIQPSGGNTRYLEISSRAPTLSFPGSPSPLPRPSTGSTRFSDISLRAPTPSFQVSPPPLPQPSTGTTQYSDISSAVPSIPSRRTRTPSMPSSVGNTESSATASTAPAGTPPNSAPSTPRSMWREPSPKSYTSSLSVQPPDSPLSSTGTPETPDLHDVHRGGPSDTPPVSIFSIWGPNERELHNRSVSRQLYIYHILTDIRNRGNWFTSIFTLLHWRFITYPYRMYIRPALLNWLFLSLLCTSYPFILHSCYWPTVSTPVISPIPSGLASIPLVWLILHLFDLYRAISYTTLNPPHIFPGHWTDLTIRHCATFRPLARLTVLLSVLLSCLEPHMTSQDWDAALSKTASMTFALSLVCGGVEVLVYWFVGFFRRRCWMAYTMGGAEIGVFERWEVERVMPWGTVVAVFVAVWFALVYFEVAVVRGWFFFPPPGMGNAAAALGM